MLIEWWHWVILGFTLAAVEIAAPFFFIIWFGVGAISVGLVLLVTGSGSISLISQMWLWLVFSLSFTLVWFGFFHRKKLVTQVGTAQSGLAGELGVLVSEVTPFTRGEVRFQKPIMGFETWPCIADESIQAGSCVKIIAIEGHWVRVSSVK